MLNRKNVNNRKVNVVKGLKGFQKVNKPATAPASLPDVPKTGEIKIIDSFSDNVSKFENYRKEKHLFYRQIADDYANPASYIMHSVSLDKDENFVCPAGWITEAEYVNRIRHNTALLNVLKTEQKEILQTRINRLEKQIRVANTTEVVAFGVGSFIVAAVGVLTPVGWWAAGIAVPFLTVGKGVDVFMKNYVKKKETELHDLKLKLNEVENKNSPSQVWFPVSNNNKTSPVLEEVK